MHRIVFHRAFSEVCVYMCIPHIVAKQRLCKHVPTGKNTHNNRRIVGCIVLYVVRFYQRRVCGFVCVSLYHCSVNTFPRQREIVGGVFFYAVRVVSEESRRLLFLRTFSPGVKQQGCDADHSPPSSAEVKKMWIYTSTPPYAFMA
jgi:hypothetical protein